MSLLTSLSSGTTGLASASEDLSVIGDNISNANTVGFKEGRAAFEDALAQSVVGGKGQIGIGSRLQAVQKILSQGALTNTGNATDLALQGSGFFEVSGTASDGRQGTFLTRAGQFTVNKDGYLVNLDGMRVQGYAADDSGNITSALGDLQVGNASSSPKATGTVTLKGNLQADAPALAGAINPTDPTTYTFSTSATIYDSLGANYQVQLYFSNQGGGNWNWSAYTDGGGVIAPPPATATGGTPFLIGSGTAAFDGQGRLTGATGTTVAFTPANGAQAVSVALNFGTPTAAGGTGLDGFTQFAGNSSTTFVGQDGYDSGQLSSIQIDKSGTVHGIFTNGQTRAIGQVGVARVAAPDQLERTGGNLYAMTSASGQAVMGAAGDGGRAFITSGALEQSNVDIADQFVRMISAQRNFEANSKTITTADQLLSELIAMKR